jgi:hypothetical protein
MAIIAILVTKLPVTKRGNAVFLQCMLNLFIRRQHSVTIEKTIKTRVFYGFNLTLQRNMSRSTFYD